MELKVPCSKEFIRHTNNFYLPVNTPENTAKLDFPGGSVDRNPPASAGDTGSVLVPGRLHRPWSN